MQNVIDRLAALYTADETRQWLYARHPMLDGSRAVGLIGANRTEEVIAVIERLEAGAYL